MTTFISSDEMALKAEIIALLDYPMMKMQNHLQLEECPHAGYFDHNDLRCVDCFQGEECLWVQHSDSSSSCQKKSLTALIKLLQTAIDFIDFKLVPAHRSRRCCHCDNCSWLARANALMDRLLERQFSR